ncbi:MAG: DUF2155 domain-containing protein [Alphaproteobacteria bacterium]|nr:DUF2155 domain-containing protein [Alphaproteobacteria bacterium]
MRKIIVPLLVVFAAFGAHAYIDRDTAVLQVMNKAAGKTQTITAPVGRAVVFEKLNITVRACKQSDPFDAENFYAFTEISKSDGEMFYSNWMNRNNPGKNPVQNADYDVWLVRCE